MANDPKSPEDILAEFEAQEAAMNAELKALGLPELTDFSAEAYDPDAAFKDYPEIVRKAFQTPKEDLATTLGALLDAGADPNAKAPYNDTALDQCFRRSAFDAFRLLLSRGAKLPDWGWGPDHMVVAVGKVPEPIGDLMARDHVGRTPVLLACRMGNLDALKKLWPLTPEAGRSDVPDGDGPAYYAALSGDTETLDWVIAQGAEINAGNRHGRTPLLGAVESDDVALAEILLSRGADPHLGENISQAMRDHEAERTTKKSVIEKAADIMMKFTPGIGSMPDTVIKPANAAYSPAMARLLADHGALITDFEDDMVPYAIGTDRIAPETITPEMFKAQYSPRAGTANPERVDVAFWREQIRTGHSGWKAMNDIIGERQSEFCGGDPVWSFQRFGRTATRLSDGRWVLVAGEHEDHYDPDFCIYADVTVIHPDGSVDHYLYPPDVFPPTDFHTATHLGDHILLIGSLGYQGARPEGVTQVLRLNLEDFSIEPVDTTGDNPGWINRHTAKLVEGAIVVSGGHTEPGFKKNTETFRLNLQTMTWSRA